MKYQWEESDIRLGREVLFNADERLVIGYVVGSAHKRRCLIHLTDGAVYRERTIAELVDDLNAGNYQPRYIQEQIKMSYREPQGEARWASVDFSEVRSRQAHYQYTPDWRRVYLYLLEVRDEESAHLVRLRNDHDYRERVEEEARKVFESAPLKSLRENQSEIDEMEAA